jgi:hypothetical protein
MRGGDELEGSGSGEVGQRFFRDTFSPREDVGLARGEDSDCVYEILFFIHASILARWVG